MTIYTITLSCYDYSYSYEKAFASKALAEMIAEEEVKQLSEGIKWRYIINEHKIDTNYNY